MNVLINNRLNSEFLENASMPIIRSFLKSRASTSQIKGRSRDELLEKIKQLKEDISILTISQFREAMWYIMEYNNGACHIGLNSLNQFFENSPQDKLEKAHILLRNEINSIDSIETGNPIDVQWMSGNHDGLRILYLGEAESEIYDEDKSYDKTIDGEKYNFKAYRLAQVPIISQIDIGLHMPFLKIMTRAIHQGAKPTREVEGLQTAIEQIFEVVFPTLDGIARGLQYLWGNRIEPRKYDVEESDGTKASIARAPGVRNQQSINIENQLAQWEIKSGYLLFDGNIPFRVDAGRALFSFNSRTSKEKADDIIHAILSA